MIKIHMKRKLENKTNIKEKQKLKNIGKVLAKIY